MNLMCTNKVIKYLMFTFNFIFVITGIILIAVGGSIKAYYYKYDTFLDDKYFSLPNLLIATGSLIFFISFLGCYGAIKENWIMLMAFSVLLCVIFIFEFSAGIAGYVLRDKTSSYLEDKLYSSMPKYNSSREIMEMWDIIQEKFECCGVYNYSDWHLMSKSSVMLELPVSCCPQSSGTIGVFYCHADITTPATLAPLITPAPPSTTKGPEEPPKNETETVIKRDAPNNTTTTAYPPSTSKPYSVGCEAAFGKFVKEHAVDIGGVGIALAVIQLIGIIFSCHLSRQLKNGYYST